MELMNVRIPHPVVGAITWFGQQQLVNPKLSADEHEKRFVVSLSCAFTKQHKRADVPFMPVERHGGSFVARSKPGGDSQ